MDPKAREGSTLPELTVQPVRPGSVVMVVGNGPSSYLAPWPKARQQLAERHGGTLPDLFLMNRTALGKTRARYAVAVGPEVICEYVALGLWRQVPLLTRAPDSIVGPDSLEMVFGPYLDDPASLFAPAGWPSHASGPLAAWAAAALGYETVYLYGLDGTAGPPPPGQDDFAHRAATWEHWTVRWREARAPVDHGAAQRVVRAWPHGCGVPMARDPLRDGLADALVLPP